MGHENKFALLANKSGCEISSPSFHLFPSRKSCYNVIVSPAPSMVGTLESLFLVHCHIYLSCTGQRPDKLMQWAVVRQFDSNSSQNHLILKNQQWDFDETSQE